MPGEADRRRGRGLFDFGMVKRLRDVAELKMREAGLSGETFGAITEGNARRLFA